MTAHLRAERYERGPQRRGYRNGYQPRRLHTRVISPGQRVCRRDYTGLIAISGPPCSMAAQPETDTAPLFSPRTPRRG